MSSERSYTISYGKSSVPVYRVYAKSLDGVPRIPESDFTGRDNTLFAAEVDVEVFGDNFLPAYTQGDNSNVVATDSMKNFILRHALDFDGATLESFVATLGRGLLETYPVMEALRITGRELPFVPAQVPRDGGFGDSSVLFARQHGDYATAALDFARTTDADGVTVAAHQCGQVDLQLLKVTGSSFTRFVRDDYTTLPDRVDRPLYIFMDVSWTYSDVADMLAPNHARYVAHEQVRDLVSSVFHEFVSESIQHLVHEMGNRILDRFPQLTSVSFAAQNRTRDPVAAREDDEKVRVYSDPFPAFGLIKLTMTRTG
jgi:urate oxidase